MTTLDASARADIASRPWYVAAFRGRDVINYRPFGIGPSESCAQDDA